METPFFSIIIPCYNQGIYLHDSVGSLQLQAFTNWEALIVNDGSEDNTDEIAGIIAKNDTRVRVIKKQNGGLSSARNAGIRNSRGRRLIFLDADDYLEKNCLDIVFRTACGIEDSILIRYGYSYVSEDLKHKLHTVLPPSNKEMIPFVFYNVPGPCHTICVSRAMAEKTGFFDESLRALEDWDFWIRAAKAGGVFRNIPESLACYRRVPGSMSRNPDIMLDSAKTVVSRIPSQDERINTASDVNGNNIYFDINPILKNVFIRIMGISILKGDLSNSLRVFEKETRVNSYEYIPSDFTDMCSALTFRYATDYGELRDLIHIKRPVFRNFFQQAGFTDSFTKEALYCIFAPIQMKYNRKKYGTVTSKIPNFFLRLRYGYR